MSAPAARERIRPREDDPFDRRQVEARRRVQLSRTNGRTACPALPLGTIGSLWPTFVPARHVRLAVSPLMPMHVTGDFHPP